MGLEIRRIDLPNRFYSPTTLLYSKGGIRGMIVNKFEHYRIENCRVAKKYINSGPRRVRQAVVVLPTTVYSPRRFLCRPHRWFKIPFRNCLASNIHKYHDFKIQAFDILFNPNQNGLF